MKTLHAAIAVLLSMLCVATYATDCNCQEAAPPPPVPAVPPIPAIAPPPMPPAPPVPPPVPALKLPAEVQALLDDAHGACKGKKNHDELSWITKSGWKVRAVCELGAQHVLAPKLVWLQKD